MSDEHNRAVYVIVRGVVQGVGFRYHALWQATEHGVTGWVRNRPDGAVEALIEGPSDAVDAMIAWLRRGPASAAVRDVYTQERRPEGHKRFEITY